MLFHISEEAGVARFDPRPAPNCDEPVVWAINEEKLRNYLLPRDCPRVTFFAGPVASPADVLRLLGSSPAVVAIEAGWLDRVRRTRLFCYSLPEESFHCVDANAGYFHCKQPVVPIEVQVIEDPTSAIRSRGVELRVLPSLWELHDAVIASTLSYSIIRMRNAEARPAN